jgi:hypothetical protein
LPTPPKNTTSYYIQQNSTTAARELGCNARKNKEHGLAVLDFGAPQILSSGEYGTLLITESNQKVGLTQIKAMLSAFAQGYLDTQNCSGAGGTSVADLVLVAGVNNSALYDTSNRKYYDNPYLTVDHGRAWAEMLDSLFSRIPRQTSLSRS